MSDGSVVCAVVVTYQPDRAALCDLLAAIAGQVGEVVVVDNSADKAALHDQNFPQALTLLRQQTNIGLAAAQNIGIAWARQYNYRYVLLLDQDSTPSEGMVKALLDALTLLSAMGKVAAVGPRFHDLREDHDAPFVRIGFPFNRKLRCERDTQQVACDFLISSGALIPLAVLDHVGLMDASLFIDNVDLEWSFRARSFGYALYGVCAATMHHRLGDGRRRLPWGGQVVVHAPVRLYYIMRNRLRLYRMPHTPGAWIAKDLPRALAKLFLFGVLIGPRWQHLRCMLRGLWDGLRGRQGAVPSSLLR